MELVKCYHSLPQQHNQLPTLLSILSCVQHCFFVDFSVGMCSSSFIFFFGVESTLEVLTSNTILFIVVTLEHLLFFGTCKWQYIYLFFIGSIG